MMCSSIQIMKTGLTKYLMLVHQKATNFIVYEENPSLMFVT